MDVSRSFHALRNDPRPVFLAVGFFDGVHRGHRNVVRRAVVRARRIHGRAWVMTFDPHPLDVLSPGSAPPLLTSNFHKLELLRREGPNGCLLLSFTRQLARLTPEAFAARLLSAVPTLREILVGTNWRFGREGVGTPQLLARLVAPRGVTVTVVEPVRFAGRPISSTRIRSAVTLGRLGTAARMLGRPFSVLGTVVHGQAIGRQLGFPTANLDVQNEVLPPCGVYAARARVGTFRFKAVLNLGFKPTTLHHHPAALPTLEVHLPGFSGNLYGKVMEVCFLRKLRNERHFSSPEALRRQIARDIARA